MELLSPMVLATGTQKNVAKCSKFFVGVVSMMALGILLPEKDHS